MLEIMLTAGIMPGERDVSRSTKISNIFLYNSQPRGLTVDNGSEVAAKGHTQNRRLQNLSPGPSLIRLFHSRKFCAVNDSSCAVIYIRGAII